MPYVVTGISQNGDTVALEAALKAAGLTLDAFEVLIREDDAPPAAATGFVDTSLLTGGLETGTGVPGLTGSGVPGIAGAARSGTDLGDSLWDRLADLAIPDDEVENYAEALESGRSIVAYHGDAKTVSKIEGLFTSNGLTKVTTF